MAKRMINSYMVLIDEKKLAVYGIPQDPPRDGEDPHDCEKMGCEGIDHIIAIAKIEKLSE